MPKRSNTKTYDFKLALLGATMLIGLGTPFAYAQDATPATTEDDTVVVVTGSKRSFADALKMKRSNVEFTDSISSEGMDRIPDLNLGEALQRLPGVQINREADGRNASINIRGLPGEYAKMTLDGVAFAEPVLGEATPLGAFQSDIFSAVTIAKSPTAGTASGGISGLIDLQLTPALDRKDGGYVKANYEYNELGKIGAPGLTVAYNKHFGSDFAVFGVIAFKEEEFRRDSISQNSYTPLNPANTPNFATLYADYYAAPGTCTAAIVGCVTAPTGTGAKGKKGVLFPSQPRQFVRYNKGTLLSSSFGGQYRASEDLKFSLTGVYTRREQKDTDQSLFITGLSDTSNVIITPTGPILDSGNGNFHVNDISFVNPDIVYSSRKFPQLQSAWGLNGRASYKNENWRSETILSYSEAENTSVETQFDANIQITNRATPAVRNGITGTLKTGGSNINNFSYVVNAPNFNWAGPWSSNATLNSFGEIVGDTSGVNGAPGYRLAVTGSESFATTTLKAVQQDVERFFDNGIFSGVQAGLRMEQNTFLSQGFRNTSYGISTSNINSSFFLPSNPYVGDFFNGNGGNYSTIWPQFDLQHAIDALKPVTPLAGTPQSTIGLNVRTQDNQYRLNNYTNETNINAVYLMAKVDTELFSRRVTGNIGVRYEEMETTITSKDRDLNKKFVDTVHKGSEDNLLPSYVFKVDLTDTLLFRTAGYKTYVRPHPRQFSPVTVVGDLNEVTDAVSVTIGNPDLKPYKADSYDFGFEWYNRPNSVVSLSYYRKEIKGLLVNETRASKVCPPDASSWGLDTLYVSGDFCFSTLRTFNGQPIVGTDGQPRDILVFASGWVNSDNPIEVDGFELNVQQNFDFLPAPFDKFGGVFNYSVSDIKGKAVNGTEAILPGVSKNAYNLVLFYDTPRYGARVAYNHRDTYDLASAGTFTGAARSVAPRGQLDMTAYYNIIPNRMTISFDLFNLTDELRYEYEGVESKARRVDSDGTTAVVTLRASF